MDVTPEGYDDVLEGLYREYDRMLRQNSPEASTQRSLIREYKLKKEKNA